MSGPGDRATKYRSLEEPTPSRLAEGHDPAPKSADLEQAFLPGSMSSARSEMSPAREPGDLEGASEPVVGSRQPREGEKPQAAGYAFEKSDEVVVPEKSTKTWVTPVEPMEGRTEAEGKSAARNAPPTQSGNGAPTALQRIGQRAKEGKEERFTNLLSHVKLPLLKEAYQRLRKHAAAGVDEVTWLEYGERLEERLLDLETRVHRGSYHPLPVRRVHIPKGDGSTRPLGIPALEDKLLQQAVRMVLEPVYEAQFVGFSYGFRPGRSPQQALDALAVAIEKKVSWVLDADIGSFFNTIDHGWMQRFVEHRIGDRRLVRLLMKWLKAGVMEDGELHAVEEGTPQGGVISPLLANVYLHYALDLSVGPILEEEASTRRGVRRALRGRLRDGLPARAGRTSDARGPGQAPREVRPGATPGQDTGDSVWTLRPTGLRAGRVEQARDVRLPGLHAHLRRGPTKRLVPAETSHLAEEKTGKADPPPRRNASPETRADGEAACLAEVRADGALPLLRRADEHPCPRRLPV